MIRTAFDGDTILTEFLSEYLDGRLDKTERDSFESYLEKNKPERELARKAALGKKALSRLSCRRIRATDDFEAKLALRLQTERDGERKQSGYLEH